MTFPYGQRRSLANLFPLLGIAEGSLMTDTCGPSSSITSNSINLQSCLENRLKANSDGIGSPGYALTWKHWAITPRRRICAVLASARPKKDSAFTGWPTPRVGGNGRTGRRYKGRLEDATTLAHFGSNTSLSMLEMAAQCGPLNPEFSLWLMGYPNQWFLIGAQVMQSSLK